jgi:hypothetical protein
MEPPFAKAHPRRQKDVLGFAAMITTKA